LHRSRAALLASLCILPAIAAARTATHTARPVATQPGDSIASIRIEGNQRIEEGTILSYMLVQPGDPFGSDRVDRSLRTLYATGLFTDVTIQREGTTLVVHVRENPLVNNITFEGNHNVKEEDLKKALELRSRAVFTTRMAQQDRGKLLGVYAGKGRFAATVDPFIQRLPQNRVNVIFKIVEGPETKISRIVFVGNKAFTENDLKGVIDSREERLWRFFSSSDQFNPERVNFDRELIRRYYLEHGYADVVITNTVAELSPERTAFFLTFQIIEGERYRVGHVTVKSNAPKVDASPYKGLVQEEEGAFYNGNLVEKSSDLIQNAVRRTNANPFLVVNPRIARDRAKHVVDLEFDISQGPKTYVERIDISGNTVTRDRVLRRRQGDRQYRSDREGHRRAVAGRRLFHHLRHPGPGRSAPAQPDRHRHRCRHQRHRSRPPEPDRHLRHRPILPRPQFGGWRRHLLPDQQQPIRVGLQRNALRPQLPPRLRL